MLLTECEWAGAEIRMKTNVKSVAQEAEHYRVNTGSGSLTCESLVIACGGLSIPTMGATGFGYEIAGQFGLTVLPTRAGLVPFTLHPELKQQLAPLSGVSCPVEAACNHHHFREPMLVTHRGLSGPSMLQISSFWQPGDPLTINLLPERNIQEDLASLRKQNRSPPWLNTSPSTCPNASRRHLTSFMIGKAHFKAIETTTLSKLQILWASGR